MATPVLCFPSNYRNWKYFYLSSFQLYLTEPIHPGVLQIWHKIYMKINIFFFHTKELTKTLYTDQFEYWCGTYFADNYYNSSKRKWQCKQSTEHVFMYLTSIYQKVQIHTNVPCQIKKKPLKLLPKFYVFFLPWHKYFPLANS